jgi:hypothetical protein
MNELLSAHAQLLLFLGLRTRYWVIIIVVVVLILILGFMARGRAT